MTETPLPPPVAATPPADFNDKIRACVVVFALLIVGLIAIGGTVLGFKEVALVCVGALVATLNQSVGYLTRGRVAAQTNDSPPTLR